MQRYDKTCLWWHSRSGTKAEMASTPNRGHPLQALCNDYPWDSEVRQLLRSEISVRGEDETAVSHSPS